MDLNIRIDTVKKLVEATKNLDKNAAEDALNKFYSMCNSDDLYKEFSNKKKSAKSKLQRILFDAYYPYMNFSYNPIVRMPLGFRDVFIDLVFIPKQMERVPLVLIEAEVDKSPYDALTKMKEGHYEDCLLNYGGPVTYLGVNLDTKEDKFSCEFSAGRKTALF